jgi:hypothetical protein
MRLERIYVDGDGGNDPGEVRVQVHADPYDTEEILTEKVVEQVTVEGAPLMVDGEAVLQRDVGLDLSVRFTTAVGSDKRQARITLGGDDPDPPVIGIEEV